MRVRSEGAPADYPVYVGVGVLERAPELIREHAPAHRYAVISDETVADLHGSRVLRSLKDAGRTADGFDFPAGERHKIREQWIRLTDELLEAGLGRDGAVVAVGGGVTGDLAGFVAATYLRGVPVVQVPTSLVAMVDASVGGKTGVDVPAGKNLVGAFHPPRAVVADPRVIRTLPRSERAQGLAEAVKHGAILDRDYLEFLHDRADALLDAESADLLDAVHRSVEIKADIVSRDEREGGLRKVLNFGHTLGHALEAATGFGLSHGSAVAVGMVLEARLGEHLGRTERGTADRLARIVHAFDLPSRPPQGIDPDEVLRFTSMDKKGRAGEARYVLLAHPGEVARGDDWSHVVPRSAVRKVLAEAGVASEPAG